MREDRLPGRLSAPERVTHLGIAVCRDPSYGGNALSPSAPVPAPHGRVPLIVKSRRTLLPALVAVLALSAAAAPAHAQDRADLQSTDLVSRSLTGSIPNAPSGNSMISGDKRYARV